MIAGMTLRVSVLIVTFNSEAHVVACLEALLPELHDDDEVIVVDNASRDQSLTLAQRYSSRVQVIASPVNRGFAGGNDLAAEAATGDLLILLNPDTRIRRGWRSALVGSFADESIGVVGCKGLYPDGRVQHAGGRIDRGSAFATHIGEGEVDAGGYDRIVDVDYVSGFALATRRTIWQRLGGLCVDFYPAFFEEIDYCYRVRRHGARIIYQPSAVVEHDHRSLDGDKHSDATFVQRQRWLFALRHFDPITLRQIAAHDSRLLTSLGVDGVGAGFVGVYTEARALWGQICIARCDDPTLGGPVSDEEQGVIARDLEALSRQALRLAAGGTGPAAHSELALRLRALPLPPTVMPIEGQRLRDRLVRWLVKPYLDPPGAAWNNYLSELHAILEDLLEREKIDLRDRG